VNLSMIYLTHCKNFLNATMYAHPEQQQYISYEINLKV
jgi:hypothetical protein